jgi:uncharacterized membrane protein
MQDLNGDKQQGGGVSGRQEGERPVNKPVTKLNKLFSAEARELRVTLLSSPEGRLFVAGAGMGLIFIAWISANFAFSPEMAQMLIGLLATQIMFGRATSMSFGYAGGLGHSVVVPVNMLIETILVFTFYPLFVFSWRHIVEIRRLKGFIERTRRAGERHKDVIRKYGVVGLFVFVWFPFWMTGPFVGSVIGFMLGIRLWVNMTVVLSGTFLAMLGWAVLLRAFHQQLATYSPYAPLVMVALLIVIIIGGHVLHQLYHKKGWRKGQNKGV